MPKKVIYRYPNDINDSNSSYLMFTRIKHNGPLNVEKLQSINSTFFKETGVNGAIALPMPNNFEDSMSANYTDLQASDIIDLSVNQALTKSGNTLAKRTVGENAKLSGELVAQARIGATQATLVFDNIGVKNYTFNWSLLPESLEEARNIENIIKQFKLTMLPTNNAGSKTTTFPDLVQIEMGGVTSKLINFLPCIITDVSFNPTPDGYYQIYQSGHFPNIDFSVTVSEMVSRTIDIESKFY